MKPSSLSVVIVNYNTRDDLYACLSALNDSQLRPQIIVVDNASSDGSAEMVESRFPEVVLLALDHNSWFCGGNNLGIQRAQGDYVLLLNPDTLPQPGSLAAMVAFLDEQPEYLGVTVQLRYPHGGIQRTCSRIPTYGYLLLSHTVLGWLCPGRRATAAAHHWYAEWRRDTDCDIEVMPGSCTMLRREIAGYDPRLLLYFPEDDLARRFPTARFRFLADGCVIHKEKGSTRTWLATRVYFRDMLIYTRQHHGWLRAGLLWLLSRPLLWAIALRWSLRRAYA